MNLLIADDDRILTSLLATRLRSRGWNVDVAQDSMQAVMFAIRTQPSVILLDLNMPGGSGFDVLRKLKVSVRTSRIPVVVLSASHTPEDERQVEELGVAAFLEKPVDLDLLNATLVSVIKP
jgi:two-component system KDP operon response regulator KdpE